MVVEEPHPAADEAEAETEPERAPDASANPPNQRGKTVHGEAANAGHRVLAPDDAEVEAYLETALHAPTLDPAPGDRPVEPDAVIVLDFGSQFAQLIARRVRELNVYSERRRTTPLVEIQRRALRRRSSSGRPELRLRRRRAASRPGDLARRIPVLGICYGAQLMAHELGGDVLPASARVWPAQPSRSRATTARPAASTATSQSG